MGKALKPLAYLCLIVALASLIYVDYEAISENLTGIAQSLIPSAIVTLLIAFYFEFLAKSELNKLIEAFRSQVDGLSARIKEDVISIIVSEESFENILGGALRETIGEEKYYKKYLSCLSMIARERRFILDADIRLTMCSLDDNEYELLIEESFFVEKQFEEIIVCFSTRASTIEKLANYSMSVDKIYIPSTIKSSEEVVRIEDHIKVFCSSATGDRARPSEVRPEIVPYKIKDRLTRDVGLSSDDLRSLYMYRFKIKNDGRLKYVRLEYRETDRLETGHCFWLPDRPTYVKSIEFNYSDVSSRIESVAAMGFFLSPSSEPSETDIAFRKRFIVNGWLLPGHGAAFRWSCVRQ